MDQHGSKGYNGNKNIKFKFIKFLSFDFHFDNLCLTSIGKAWSRLHIKKSDKSSLKNLDSRDVQRERL